MSLHIHRPKTFNWRTNRHCPTCERRRWFLASHAIWYGTTLTCLGCGDTWTDGERHERPFAPAWRERSIAAAKRKPYLKKADADAAIVAELESYTTEVAA